MLFYGEIFINNKNKTYNAFYVQSQVLYAMIRQGLTNTERRFMLNAERGDCASVAKIIEQQATLTEQGQQAVRDTSQDSLGGERQW